MSDIENTAEERKQPLPKSPPLEPGSSNRTRRQEASIQNTSRVLKPTRQWGQTPVAVARKHRGIGARAKTHADKRRPPKPSASQDDQKLVLKHRKEKSKNGTTEVAKSNSKHEAKNLIGRFRKSKGKPKRPRNYPPALCYDSLKASAPKSVRDSHGSRPDDRFGCERNSFETDGVSADHAHVTKSMATLNEKSPQNYSHDSDSETEYESAEDTRSKHASEVVSSSINSSGVGKFHSDSTTKPRTSRYDYRGSLYSESSAESDDETEASYEELAQTGRMTASMESKTENDYCEDYNIYETKLSRESSKSLSTYIDSSRRNRKQVSTQQYYGEDEDSGSLPFVGACDEEVSDSSENTDLSARVKSHCNKLKETIGNAPRNIPSKPKSKGNEELVEDTERRQSSETEQSSVSLNSQTLQKIDQESPDKKPNWEVRWELWQQSHRNQIEEKAEDNYSNFFDDLEQDDTEKMMEERIEQETTVKSSRPLILAPDELNSDDKDESGNNRSKTTKKKFRKQACRASDAMNEDSYDFAIIVRAVFTAQQEKKLQEAREEADAIMAANATFREALVKAKVQKQIGSIDGYLPVARVPTENLPTQHRTDNDGFRMTSLTSVPQESIGSTTTDNESTVDAVNQTIHHRSHTSEIDTDLSEDDSLFESDEDDESSLRTESYDHHRCDSEESGKGIFGGALQTLGSKMRSRTEESYPSKAQRKQKCAEILASLRAAGLHAKRVRSLSRQKWLIKIKAPEWRLEEEAQRMKIRMRRRDGGWSRFKRKMRHAFLPAIPEAFCEEDPSCSHIEHMGYHADTTHVASEYDGNADSIPQQSSESYQVVNYEDGNEDSNESGSVSSADDISLQFADDSLGHTKGNNTTMKSAFTGEKTTKRNTNRVAFVDQEDSYEKRTTPRQQVRDSAGLCNLYGRRNECRTLFHSSDRQLLINSILRSSSQEGGADLNENTPLGAYITKLFPLHMYARLAELRNDWLYWWRPNIADGSFDRIGPKRESAEATVRLDKISAHLQTMEEGNATEMINEALNASPRKRKLAKFRDSVHNVLDSNLRAPSQTGICSRIFGWFSQAYSCLRDYGDRGFFHLMCWCCVRRVSRFDVPEERRRRLPKCCICCWCCYFGNTPRTVLEEPYYTCQPEANALCCPSLRSFALCKCFCGLFNIIAKCGRSWKRFYSKLLSQPLDRIAAYFGEMVGFYFAWLEFYTHWLVLPAIAGTGLFIVQMWYGTVDVEYVPLFSLFMALWSTLFLEFWRRKNAVLAHRWGVLNYEEEETTRPQFKGKWVQDPVTGEISKTYSSLKRGLKYMVDIPILFFSVFSVVMLLIYVFATRDSALEEVSDGDNGVSNPFTRELRHLNGTQSDTSSSESAISVSFGGIDLSNIIQIESETTLWWVALVTPAVLYGFLIPILGVAFGKVALWTNSWENHRTESSYRNHLIAKVFSFRFVHSFISLFYYAFHPKHRNSLLALAVQLASFLIVGQLSKNVLGVIWPICVRRFRRWRTKKQVRQAEDSGLTEGRRGRKLVQQAQSAAWVEASLPEYDTFNDYAEMLIQFGYVTFFSWAFPLAPLFALLNNIIGMRADAYKLCYHRQRPIAHKASGIGVWFNVLQMMSLLAVLTNCAHLALASREFQRLFPHMTDAQKIFIVFLIEHGVIGLRILVAHLIPHTPSEVQRQLTRDRYNAAKIEGRRSIL